jgi:hypothetical protein
MDKGTLSALLMDGKITAPYVVTHAAWQKSRGRRPSVAYKGINNPQKALALALEELDGPVAVAYLDVRRFGCPYCGQRSGYTKISGNGTAVVQCAECGLGFAVLAPNVGRSTIGFGDFYPELIPHPRYGIPSHGTQDKRPQGGGECFRSRDIGLDWIPCFMCPGSKSYLRPNIAAFVQSKKAGERVVAMFKRVARGDVCLDFRPSEPNRVQVKLGCCSAHKPSLEALDRLTDEAGGVITEAVIRQAMQAKPKLWGLEDLRIADHEVKKTPGFEGTALLIEFAKETIPTAGGQSAEYLKYVQFVTDALAQDGEVLVERSKVTGFYNTEADAETAMEKLEEALDREQEGVQQKEPVRTRRAKPVQLPIPRMRVKVAGSKIEPDDFPCEGGKDGKSGFELTIIFVPGSEPVATARNPVAYENFVRAVDHALGQVESPDCSHFFSGCVMKFFLTKEDAQTALAKVKALK